MSKRVAMVGVSGYIGCCLAGQVCAEGVASPNRWKPRSLYWCLVAGFELERRLSLQAEIEPPGKASLEFQMDAVNSQRMRLARVGVVSSARLVGLALRYSVVPFPAILSGIE